MKNYLQMTDLWILNLVLPTQSIHLIRPVSSLVPKSHSELGLSIMP